MSAECHIGKHSPKDGAPQIDEDAYMSIDMHAPRP